MFPSIYFVLSAMVVNRIAEMSQHIPFNDLCEMQPQNFSTIKSTNN